MIIIKYFELKEIRFIIILLVLMMILIFNSDFITLMYICVSSIVINKYNIS